MGWSVDSFEEFIPALKQLRDEGVDLNETLELTDKRSVAAFNTLLDGAETADTLKVAITGAGDAMQEMADVRMESLGYQTPYPLQILSGQCIRLTPFRPLPVLHTPKYNHYSV